jgi:hypothetical protein
MAQSKKEKLTGLSFLPFFGSFADIISHMNQKICPFLCKNSATKSPIEILLIVIILKHKSLD